MPVKKNLYFILSGIWVLTALINFYEQRPIKTVELNIFTAIIFLSLAIVQLVLENRGDGGGRIFKRICKVYAVALFVFLGCSLISALCNKQDGTTIESREKMLESLPRGFGWKIAVETEIDNNIVCGIYSRDNKSGIALFAPVDDKGYKLIARQWRDSDDIIISNFVILNKWYDIIWFNGAKTDFAQITYNIGGNEQEPVIHNAKGMELFVNPSPSEDYDVNVVYYDDAGNKYE